MREDPFLIQHFKLFLSFNYNLLRLHDKKLSTKFQYMLALLKKKNSICLLYCLYKSYALGSTNPKKKMLLTKSKFLIRIKWSCTEKHLD